MKFSRILFSLALIVFLSASLRAQDTKVTLFETFTNSYINCPAVNDFAGQVIQTLGTAEGKKTLHLNYHVTNVGDPMAAQAPSASDAYYKIVGTTNVINFGSVDRTVFSSSSLQLTSSKSEWDARITTRNAEISPVSIKLKSLTLDKISSDESARLIATVDVTTQQAIADPMDIHFAIAQDNVFFVQCPDDKPVKYNIHNDVVRYVTVADSMMDFKTKFKNTVTYSQDISKTIKTFQRGDMKLVAFVENAKTSTHEVVQAALLQMNLEDLPAPPASLALNSSILDNMTFAPGDLVTVLFDKVNIDSVKIEYSSNAGTSWQTIGVTHNFRMYWNAPGVTTTKGRIRISDMKNGAIVSTETATFIIKQADHSLSILRPNADDIVYIGQKFTITWNQHAVDTLFIEYSTDDGSHWQTLNFHKDPTHTANSFQWNVQGAAAPVARVRLRPFDAELSGLTSTSDPFQVRNVTGGVSTSSEENFRISINPQPAKRSEKLNLNLKLDSYSGVDISLYDMSGKKVLTKDRANYAEGNSMIALDLGSIPAGTYVLEVKRDDGQTRVVKVEIL